MTNMYAVRVFNTRRNTTRLVTKGFALPTKAEAVTVQRIHKLALTGAPWCEVQILKQTTSIER